MTRRRENQNDSDTGLFRAFVALCIAATLLVIIYLLVQL